MASLTESEYLQLVGNLEDLIEAHQVLYCYKCIVCEYKFLLYSRFCSALFCYVCSFIFCSDRFCCSVMLCFVLFCIVLGPEPYTTTPTASTTYWLFNVQCSCSKLQRLNSSLEDVRRGQPRQQRLGQVPYLLSTF